MKVYYAHCMAIYGKPVEERDIDSLTRMGFDVVNPNTPEIAAAVLEVKRLEGDVKNSDLVMNTVFKPLVLSADVFAFRGLPDGSIPSGVMKELVWATIAGKPIIELPSNISRRELSVSQTRAYLAEAGQR